MDFFAPQSSAPADFLCVFLIFKHAYWYAEMFLNDGQPDL